MTITPTFSFDTIARDYDGQRSHPPEVAAQVGQALAAAAGRGAQLLELGVGTGRIALPALAAGCRVTGVDISREMLRVAQGRAALPLIQADIARLPFVAESFDAVVAVHVLHLVSDWRATLSEAWRVIRPGGALIQGRDWRSPDSCAGRLRARLREVVMELQPGIRPPGAGAAVPQALARLGGQTEPDVVAARWTVQISPAQVLEQMAQRSDAETWALDDRLLDAALERLRDWSAATWGDLEATQTVERMFVLSVTRK